MAKQKKPVPVSDADDSVDDERMENAPPEVTTVDSAKPAKRGSKSRSVSVDDTEAVPIRVNQPDKKPAAEPNSRRKFLLAGGIVVLVALAAGVFAFLASRGTNTTVNGNIDQADTTPTEPLTGVRLLDGTPSGEDVVARWPIAVMLDNLPSARPQYGISLGRVVYETLAEGGTTRFMALFDGSENPDKLGPVRSARHYYIQLADEYHAAYVHAGGSPQADVEFRKSSVTDFNLIGSAAKYGYRVTFKSAPHNLFTDDGKLTFALRDKDLLEKPATYASWAFSPEPVLADRPETALKVTVPFSTASYEAAWTYNRVSNLFERTMAGQPHIDGLNNQRVVAKNVIIMNVPAETSLVEKGRIDMKVTGEGKLSIFQDGKQIDGIWKKPTTKDRLQFFDAAGTLIPLHPGPIWIEVLPAPRTVTVSQ